MSYEYKEIIKSRVYEPNALPLYWEAQTRGVGVHIVIKDALKELDHVYAQAAEYKEYRADTEKLYNALKAKGEREIQKYKTKSDDYESKAEAFDNLVDVAYWHFERIHPDDDNGLQYESFYDDIRDEFKKLESGEPNELRE